MCAIVILFKYIQSSHSTFANTIVLTQKSHTLGQQGARRLAVQAVGLIEEVRIEHIYGNLCNVGAAARPFHHRGNGDLRVLHRAVGHGDAVVVVGAAAAYS